MGYFCEILYPFNRQKTRKIFIPNGTKAEGLAQSDITVFHMKNYKKGLYLRKKDALNYKQ